MEKTFEESLKELEIIVKDMVQVYFQPVLVRLIMLLVLKSATL